VYRLYFVEVVSEDFILVLDTDIYAGRWFFGELMDIIDRDHNNSLIYAVHDLWAEHSYRTSLNLTLTRYVNGGVYVIRNIPEGKALMRLARRLVIENIRDVAILDQDALNLALEVHPDRLYILPGYFNCHYGWCWDRTLHRQAIHHRKGAYEFKKLRIAFAEECPA
jgi:lipopolysaccharide biosynthesis glycosyltransferase